MISQLLKNLNNKESLASVIIRNLDSDRGMPVPHGKLWVERQCKKQAFITLVQDMQTKNLNLCVRINDGKDTTFNNVKSYIFNEDDDQFFNLFVLINKNCLLR